MGCKGRFHGKILTSYCGRDGRASKQVLHKMQVHVIWARWIIT
jgi:hypothetical protein